MQSKSYPLSDPPGLVAKIAEMGGPQIDPAKPNGVATSHGVKLGWSILDGEITISILSKPFFVSQETVWKHVDTLFGLSVNAAG